jgi:hypothetical protein
MKLLYNLDCVHDSLNKNEFKHTFLNIFNFIINHDFIYDSDKKFLIKYIHSNVINKDLDHQFIQTIFYYLLYHDSNNNSFVKFYIELYLIKYKKFLKYFWNGLMEFLLEYEYNENKNNYKIIDIYYLCVNNNLHHDLKDLFKYGIIYENIDCIDFFINNFKKKIPNTVLYDLIDNDNIELFNYIYIKLNNKYEKYFNNEYLFIEHAIKNKKINFTINLYKLGLSNINHVIIPKVHNLKKKNKKNKKSKK